MKYVSILFVFFFSIVLKGYSQEFVNKIKDKLSKEASYQFAVDYIENTEDENENPVTNIYFRYIPVTPKTDYSRVMDWSTIDLVDKKTGKKYRVTDGNHIPLSLKSAFSFYNRGGEIGFSLTFKQLPESVRTIDILSQDEVWFKDIAIDPDRDDDNSFFRFSYFFKSLQFYTSVPGSTIFFTMDGYTKKDLYIDQSYDGSKRPNGCGAEGIITFAYPHSIDKEIHIKAETSSDSPRKASWSLERKPSVTTCKNFIHLSKS